ncbi:MAG: ABC transporter permease subunit [Acidimicrobiales bacterium]
MSRFLPRDPRLRSATLAALTVGGVLVLTQLILPGPAALTGRGTPWAQMFFGLVRGMTISLTTAGIVLVYRTQRVLNFAQSSVGLAGAFFFFGLSYFTNIPFPIALLLGLVLAAGTGAVVGTALLRFLDASRLVLTVVTIIGASLLLNLSSNVYRLPFFPEWQDLPVDLATGTRSLRSYLPFPGLEFSIGGSPSTFGFGELLALELAVVALLALAAFFRFTKAGVAVRAMAENPERASLLGIGVGGLTILVWTIAGALSGASTILTGVLESPSQAGGFAPTLLITAFAAAVIARMDRLPTAVLASVVITVLTEAFTYSFPDDAALVPVLLFTALSGTLLLQGRSQGRSESGAAVTWSAAEEQRPIPRQLLEITGVRWTRRALIGLGIGVLAVIPFAFSTSIVLTMGVLYLGAIVTLSVVVLTGWGGQVSLGQWGFAAVGAIVGGALTATLGLPFWIAVPVASAVTGGFAMLVGLPALRIPGLFLLPVTFAFAAAVQSAFFEDRYFGWILPDKPIERPTLFFLDFSTERSMYYLTAGCLVLALSVVSRLRRTRTGRILIALRENDASVQAFGVPVVRTKLLAFGVSGALAGFAGSVYVHQQQGLNGEVFTAFASVQAFAASIFGGLGSAAGAVLGTGFYEFIEYFGVDGLPGTFARNGGPLIIIFAAPAGLISIINALRDSVLRVVAQRRQLFVPSLFAGYDPAADGERLVPMADLEPSAGLGALPPDARWSLGSYLYRGRSAAGGANEPAEREQVPA